MKFFYKPENRIIESDEMTRKYGTEKAIPQLGIYELSVQPDYEPFGFNEVGKDLYYPVESYDSKVEQAKAALMAAGLTEAEANQALS